MRHLELATAAIGNPPALSFRKSRTTGILLTFGDLKPSIYLLDGRRATERISHPQRGGRTLLRSLRRFNLTVFVLSTAITSRTYVTA